MPGSKADGTDMKAIMKEKKDQNIAFEIDLSNIKKVKKMLKKTNYIDC